MVSRYSHSRRNINHVCFGISNDGAASITQRALRNSSHKKEHSETLPTLSPNVEGNANQTIAHKIIQDHFFPFCIFFYTKKHNNFASTPCHPQQQQQQHLANNNNNTLPTTTTTTTITRSEQGGGVQKHSQNTSKHGNKAGSDAQLSAISTTEEVCTAPLVFSKRWKRKFKVPSAGFLRDLFGSFFLSGKGGNCWKTRDKNRASGFLRR